MGGLKILVEPDGTFIVFRTADGRSVQIKVERIAEQFFGGSGYRKVLQDWCQEQRARARPQ